MQDDKKYVALLDELEGLMPVTIKILKKTNASFTSKCMSLFVY